MQNENPEIGHLFGIFKYHSLSELESIISKMNKAQAIYFIIEAVQYAHKHNVYTLAESELISKAIRQLSLPKNIEE